MSRTKYKLKKGDLVKVITGKCKGQTGVISKVFVDEGKVLVQGVNLVVKHMRPSATSEGGKISKELPIHISNVAFVNSSNETTKIGYKFLKDGTKVRYGKTDGQVL